MIRQFAKRTESLSAIFEFVSAFAESNHVLPDITRDLHFGVEEIFTNMVKYNSESSGDITIDINVRDGNLALTLMDHDVHSYDLTKTPPVDITKPMHERTPGGLGIHLVRQMMDDVLYEYDDRTAKITLIKHLER